MTLAAVGAWQFAVAANVIVSLAYLAISYLVGSGLWVKGQLASNKLGAAVALIFFSCGIGHGLHAIHLLEPGSQDSFLYWGFFNAIFEQKEYFSDYIMEKIAAEMLAKDENLKREFEERLKDEKFAKSPRARLAFFYERSPYADKRVGMYPVGRVTKELRVKS